MKKLIDTYLKREVKELNNVLDQIEREKLKNFDILCATSIKAIKNGNKIFFYGNGGSASDAQHLATELKVKYKKKRKALPAIALTTDATSITAIGNDFNFNNIFSRQIESLGKKGDIAISLTTSGKSKNLIKAAKVSKKLNIKTFCFSGNGGGLIKNYVDHTIIIPSKITSVIQVSELFLGQLYCEILEDFFLNNN